MVTNRALGRWAATTVVGLLAIGGAGALAQAQSQAHSPSQAGSMSATAAKVAIGPGYLAGEEPNTILATPQAPAAGDIRDEADRAVFRQTRALEGSPRWRLATDDAVLSPTSILNDFSCAAGVQLTPQNAPAVMVLLRHMAPDLASAYGLPKALYKRPRPFLRDPGDICVPRDKNLVDSPDYPSGHATFGWTFGMVLAELMPDRAAELMARARSFGESRAVCGVHSASAVTAARAPASVLFAALQSNPAFRRDLALAQKNIDTVRAAGPQISGSGACLAQASLIAKTPW